MTKVIYLRTFLYLSLVIGACAIVGSLLVTSEQVALAQAAATSAGSEVGHQTSSGLNGPAAPHQVGAALSDTTANDLFLPGTQPGGLISSLADTTTCTYCHVDHIVTNYAGSMMANSARDPLFRAALQVANRDVPGGGEFCLRCHSPNAWLKERASGDGADGSKLTTMDLQGVTCTTCHRLVSPTAIAGESPRDATERDHILATVGTTMSSSGAYILDREEYRRGSYQVTPPHAATQSSYMRTAELYRYFSGIALAGP